MVRLFWCLILSFSGALGQDLFDYKHTLKYAQYLDATNQLHLASVELERLHFLTPDNDSLTLSLVENYYKQNKLNLYKYRFDTLQTQSTEAKQKINARVVTALIKTKDFAAAENWLNSSRSFNSNDKDELQLFYELSMGSFKQALLRWESTPTLARNNKYNPLMAEVETSEFKKPWIGLASSAIIPGAGKCYSGQWAEGVFSFIIVGSSAFQSYRGFSRHGIKSGYGWVSGALALGFYSGNIYGGYKSVKQFNRKVKQRILNHAEDAFNASN